MMYQNIVACVLFFSLRVSCATSGIQLPPEPKDKSTPVQQRISFNGPTSISVSWNTYKKTKKPCVQYGTDENSLTMTECSHTSKTYPSSRTWANLVILKDLDAATRYYYKIESTNSTTQSFQTARAAGDMTPFTMNTLADLGLYGKNKPTVSKREEIPYVEPTVNHSTIGRLAKTINDYEFIIHPGDLAYADDWIENPLNFIDPGGKDAYAAIIERFYEQLSPISSRKPYMVSPGNHEADCREVLYHKGACPKGQYNFSDFSNRFYNMMPTAFVSGSRMQEVVADRSRAQKLANPPFWYSFDYGMVHVAMIDTETDFKDAPDAPGGSANLDSGPFGASNQQVDFLAADLASVDRSVTPWVVVAGHRPWYTNGNNAGCTPCQDAFEDLLYHYGVDIAVFGHVHNLQRFQPMYKNKVDKAGLHNPKAPMYTIIGGAGNIEGHSAIKPHTTGNMFAYNSEYGFGSLTFYNSTNLAVNFYNSRTGKVLDTAMLYKKHNKQFVRQ